MPTLRSSARIRRHRDLLPNGLKVITVEAPHLHSALLAVYVHAGSRHEAPGVMGVSHFLEHMFFRGSARFRDTVAMNARVEEVGGNLNGVTGRDFGCYDTPLHPDALEVGFDVLGDVLGAPLLRDIETERRVILEEMSDEIDERGRDVELDNLCKMALFAGHGLAHKVAGTRATVRRIAETDLRAHYARMYCARNMAVVCAGRVTRRRVLRLAGRHFGRFEPGRAVRELRPPRTQAGPALHWTVFEDSPQTALRMNFLAPPEHHADHAVLRVIQRVLDDGLSSRLPFEVVERRGLAYDVRAEIDPYADVAVFELEATTSHANVPRVITAIGEVVARLIAEGPQPDELLRAKRRHRIGLEFAADSAGDLAAWFGRSELWRPAESFATRIARIDAVTAEDVRRVGSRVFCRRNLRLVLVGRGGARHRTLVRRALEALPLP